MPTYEENYGTVRGNWNSNWERSKQDLELLEALELLRANDIQTTTHAKFYQDALNQLRASTAEFQTSSYESVYAIEDVDTTDGI